MTDRYERLQHWTWPIVIFSGLLLALRWGFNYGVGNHNTYLIHALRRADPSVLTYDWFASCQDYHPVFTYLAALLIRLDASGWLIAFGNVGAVLAGAMAIYLLIREVTAAGRALPAYLLVVAFAGIGSTYSVSGSFIFSMTFQPSTVAVVGYLFALLYFVRQRFLVSGILLAAAGLFHANYLVLAFPVFGLAHLFLGGRRLAPRLLAQLGPPLVSMALLLPLLLEQTGSPNLEYARHIYQQIVSPQHYVPRQWLYQFVVFYAWCGIGAIGGWHIMRVSETGRRLRALWVAMILLVTIATLLTTVVFLPSISQLYFWRLAPICILIAQIFAAAGLVSVVSADAPAMSHARRALLFAIFAVLIWWTFRYHYGEYRDVHLVLLMALNFLFLIQPWLARLLPAMVRPLSTVVFVCVWFVAALVPATDVRSRSNLLTGLPPAEQALYDWARTTPDEVVFLIPPDLQNFRFHAQRAIIVDTKSQPVHPDQLSQWYDRLQIVSGVNHVAGRAEAVSGYAQLDSAGIHRISENYPFDYVVVRGSQAFSGMARLAAVFENESYRVYRRITDHRPQT